MKKRAYVLSIVLVMSGTACAQEATKQKKRERKKQNGLATIQPASKQQKKQKDAPKLHASSKGDASDVTQKTPDVLPTEQSRVTAPSEEKVVQQEMDSARDLPASETEALETSSSAEQGDEKQAIAASPTSGSEEELLADVEQQMAEQKDLDQQDVSHEQLQQEQSEKVIPKKPSEHQQVKQGPQKDEPITVQSPAAQSVAQQLAAEKAPEPEHVELKVKHGERLNWLAVREWFEHAQDTIKEITQLVPRVAQQREQYISLRDQTDDMVEKTFKSVDLDLSRLETLLDYVMKQLDEVRQQEAALTDQEKILLQKMEAQKPVLETVKENVAIIHERENAIDAVIQRVIEQLKVCDSYQKQAHDFFEQIPQGTMQAKEGFYHIDALLKSIEAVQQYLSQTLKTYFTKQITQLEAALKTIQQELSALQKEGLELQKQAQQLDQLIHQIEERRQAKIAGTQEESVEQGFFARIFSSVKSFLSSLWQRIFGSSDIAK